ncbi:Sugar diacid utilization regulator [uncultured Roseburia sp.]|uniref:Helix-turn-helix domain-containing protein n=1 Tax=Brotonthovivens ammoniilytica TaxID=2981725 RepID=A0ABT2TND1_9FIRM|nr:helix-turn-helix domain-containing protein [Brotonthovivens ammoniilytica]MCU6763186.1 helix-turn-helix domain-containing protein [Brotonthovivens ammoniilytica]SCJ06105.1 Sugar diacid utilization regulator [uncultured Roseburia sp.]
MKLTLEMLLYFTSDIESVILKTSKFSDGFTNAKLLSVNQPIREEYLYIGYLSDILNKKTLLHNRITVFAVNDTPEDCQEPDFSSLDCGLILAKNTTDIFYIMNRMVESFSFAAGWDKDMHIAALEGRPLQNLIDISEDILKNPLIIFDPSFTVIAHTKHIPCEYEGFKRTLEKGYTDAETMDHVRHRNIFKKLKKNRPLIAPSASSDELVNIYYAFYSGKTLLGYACLFFNKLQPPRGYLDLLGLFNENINLCMKRDFANQRYGRMMYETFLVNLLDARGLSREQLAEQSKNIDCLPVNTRYVLGVIQFERSQKPPLTYLARILGAEMWDGRPFIYHQSICIVKSLEKSHSKDILSMLQFQRIEKLIGNFSFHMGISNVFDDLMDLKYAYRQASSAIVYGKRSGKICSLFKDHSYEYLLANAEDQMPLTFLQPDFYKDLKIYDQKNGSRCLQTILTYYECSCNATHAGQKLFVHRNTVRNIVQFVSEKWELDLENTEIKKLFLLSGLIDQYNKSSEKK